MLNKVYFIYNLVELKIEKRNIIKPLEILLKIIKKLVVLFFFGLVVLKYHFSKKRPLVFGEDNIIVSLTSFPARISSVWLTLNSLEHQTILPSGIFLYLSYKEFPEGFDSLPGKLKEYGSRGVKFIFIEENLRSHKKYFYSLKAYSEKNTVITVDDDIYYPEDTIERLLKLSKKHPKTICANIAGNIKIRNQKYLPYKEWGPALPNTSERTNLAIGAGGVLYPQNSNFSELFDICKIKRLSFFADDLWLKAIQILNGVDVAVGDYFPHPMVIPFSQKISLKSVNVEGQNLNDKQWRQLSRFFELSSYFETKL